MLEPQLGMSMERLIGSARIAEKLGFGYLFRSDHLLPTDNRRGIDSPECWTSLGGVAASTTDLKFGPMVSPVGFRNPALLAKMACTLHSYSKGRLQLAIGAGWYEPEYLAHGFKFPPFAERLGQFKEEVRILTDMVRSGRVDFDGKYFSAHTDCLPRPAGEMRLIIGAKAKSLVRQAAKHADEWNYLASPPELFAAAKKEFESAAEGRKVDISEMGPFLIGRTLEDLERNAATQIAKLGQQASPAELVKRVKARGGACGTVEEFKQAVGAKVDFGISRFYFQTLVPENVGMVELLADSLRAGI